MKKFFSILAVCAVFAVVACNNAGHEEKTTTDSVKVETNSTTVVDSTTKVVVDTMKVDTMKK